MTSQQRYKLSFTAASLLLTESIKVAEVYVAFPDWEQARDVIFQENILQSRTESRTKRIFYEAKQRLATLTDEQLDTLVNGTIDEQRQILWLAVCKCYQFIHEFATEVIHEKFLALDLLLTEADYRAFYNRKAGWHPELEEITESSQKMLRTRLFKMLNESGMVDNDQRIIRLLPSLRLVHAVNNDPAITYRIYPSYPIDFQK